MSGNDLYAETYEDYDKALEEVEATDNKAYIIRFEDFCTDHHPPVKLTLEPHT
jgi:hypothetical protein